MNEARKGEEMKKSLFYMAALLGGALLFAGGPAIAQSYRSCTRDTLRVGADVKDLFREDVGKIAGVESDAQGHVTLVFLKNVPSVKDRILAIPFYYFNCSAPDGSVVVQIIKPRLVSAPSFDSGVWPMVPPHISDSAYKYFGLTPNFSG